jgi:hypothetical protein
VRVSIRGISLDPPPGFELASLVLLGAPDRAKPHGPTVKRGTAFSPNLVVSSDPLGAERSLERFIARHLDLASAAGALADKVRPEVAPWTVEGAENGCRVELVIKGPSGERVRQIHVYALRSGRVVSVVASHLDGDLFDRARPELESALASLRLEG